MYTTTGDTPAQMNGGPEGALEQHGVRVGERVRFGIKDVRVVKVMRIEAQRVSNPRQPPGAEVRIVVRRDFRAEVQTLRPREKHCQQSEAGRCGQDGMPGHFFLPLPCTFTFYF